MEIRFSLALNLMAVRGLQFLRLGEGGEVGRGLVLWPPGGLNNVARRAMVFRSQRLRLVVSERVARSLVGSVRGVKRAKSSGLARCS